MAEVELVMPKMGESIMEATILEWLKKEGDEVEEDEAVLEIATDKVDTEVPSPTDGVISKILYEPDETVEVGEPIAIIETEGEAADDEPTGGEEPVPEPDAEPSQEPAEEPDQAPAVATTAPATETTTTDIKPRSGDRFYSPLVRNIAETEGVTMEELEQIEGTGLNNRVTKKDILQYLEEGRPAAGKKTAPSKEKVPATDGQQQAATAPTSSTQDYEGQNVEIVEMDRMRKMIAEHMSRSKKTSPHVTSFVEADVTKIVKWREKIKEQFQEREGAKLTYTPIFMEAVIKALKDFPQINASVDGDKIIIKKDINLGMAAATPSGHLIVPVIKKADEKNLIGLAKQVNDLAQRARDNQLKPEEVEGGTFTLTNVGTFGNLMGTPVINQPQVAILATGTIKKKPVVIESEEGDTIGIRHMMYLSHSYDHRVVDGALGGSFVRRVADYLEGFDINRKI